MADITINFEFQLPRYLAQRFPSLRNDAEAGFSHFDPNAIFQWPENKRWNLTDDVRTRLDAALGFQMPSITLAEDAVVAEVLREFDHQLEIHLRANLPLVVQEMLRSELNDHWQPYLHFDQTVPETYLWDYILTMSDGSAELAEGRCAIPALAGGVEVLGYRWECESSSDDPKKAYCNEGRALHMCDRLGRVLHETGKETVELAYLRIEYRSGSTILRCLEGMAGFGYREGAIPSPDHWELPRLEVDLLRAQRTVSRTVPSSFWDSIERKSPRAHSALFQAAIVVANEESRLLNPIWMRDEYIVAAWNWGYAPPSKKRSYSFARAMFMAGDDPEDERRLAAIRELEAREAWYARGLNFEEVFGEDSENNWKNARTLAADVATVNRLRRWQRVDELFDLHRIVTESLETLLRQRLNEDDVEWSRSVIHNLTNWIKRRSEEEINDELVKYSESLKTEYWAKAEPSKLHEHVTRILYDAETRVQQCTFADLARAIGALPKGKSQSLTSLDHARPIDSVADLDWNNLFLAAKILVDFRNILTHGRIDDYDESNEEVCIVDDSQNGLRVRLNSESLAMCYRLLIAVALKIHNPAEINNP